MRKEIKLSGSFIIDKIESSFLGTIVFEDRDDSIYYSWEISDERGQRIGCQSMNVDFRQVPVGQDRYVFVENHAIQNIRGFRIGREKIIKEVSVCMEAQAKSMNNSNRLQLVIILTLICTFESYGQSSPDKLVGVYISRASKSERYSIMTLKLNNRFIYKYGIGGCQGEVTGQWKIINKKIAFECDASFLNDSIIHYPNLGLTAWTVKTIGIKPEQIIDAGCLKEGNLHFRQ